MERVDWIKLSYDCTRRESLKSYMDYTSSNLDNEPFDSIKDGEFFDYLSVLVPS